MMMNIGYLALYPLLWRTTQHLQMENAIHDAINPIINQTTALVVALCDIFKTEFVFMMRGDDN